MRNRMFIVLFLSASLTCCASSSQQRQQQSRAKDKDPKYQYNLGLVYLNQSNADTKNIDEAVRYFVKALSLDTRFYQAWNGVGLAQSLKGNLAESARAFEKCLEINPAFTEARNNLGSIYQELNQLDKAEAEFQKAIQDKTYVYHELPYYNLARLYVVQGKLDEALDYVQRAIKAKPRLAMAHNLRGIILDRQGQAEEAVSAYELAVRIVPDDLQFNFNLGEAYFRTGDYGKAKDIFVKLSERATDPAMKTKVDQYLKDIRAREAAGF